MDADKFQKGDKAGQNILSTVANDWVLNISLYKKEIIWQTSFEAHTEDNNACLSVRRAMEFIIINRVRTLHIGLQTFLFKLFFS